MTVAEAVAPMTTTVAVVVLVAAMAMEQGVLRFPWQYP